jgi:hypothetical protein
VAVARASASARHGSAARRRRGPAHPTYETFRRIRQSGHTNISDETASALATMLDVPVDHVYAAARIPPRLGRFELPGRADALNPGERAAVLGVVDAILEAKVEALLPPDRQTIEEWLGRADVSFEDPAAGSGGFLTRSLRAVADTGDQADAERVDELARRDREQHESQQSRDE